MLKHLPEGLVPFEDCGFARTPYLPMENEPVYVDCRVDAQEEKPELFVCVNGGAWTAQCGEWQNERHMRFSLGAFSFGTKVCYRIQTKQEQSRLFHFEPLRARTTSAPVSLLEDGSKLHAVFEGFSVTFETEPDALSMVAHTGHVTGARVSVASRELCNQFSLQLNESTPFCQLKRLSEPIVTIERYVVKETADGCIVHIEAQGSLNAAYVWGTGERFDHVNQQGHASNGRVVEKFTQQGDQTYLPIPFFITEKGLGWYRQSSIPATMSFENGFSVSQLTKGEELTRDRLYVGKPGDVLARFVAETGEPVCPPDWAFGVWMSANGWNCDREVNEQLAAMDKHGYPADVLVLEAWSDEQTFYRWNQDGSWANPSDTVKRIREKGLHLVLWQIPIIKYHWDGEPSQALKDDVSESIEKRYCVLNADGTPYRITENWFHNSLLMDFTNPEAVAWWFEKRLPLLQMGVEGFKTDGGEFLFPNDAQLFDGSTGLEAHNRYPGQYSGVYHDFMRKHGVNGVTFSRADSTGAQTRPLHWAGDQLSLWTELAAQLTAGLSAGLSGVLFWGFDIGGFAGELPTVELYLRATAMGCFSPIMQWHAEPRSGQFYATHEDGFNNDRSPWNLAEKLNAPELLQIATDYAKLRERLKPYLIKEAAHCVQARRPMLAHLCLDFEDDPCAIACSDQYMLGRRLLVAPITTQGADTRNVYLPNGRWRNLFTNEEHAGGQTLLVRCPLERIPVYERMDGHA